MYECSGKFWIYMSTFQPRSGALGTHGQKNVSLVPQLKLAHTENHDIIFTHCLFPAFSGSPPASTQCIPMRFQTSLQLNPIMLSLNHPRIHHHGIIADPSSLFLQKNSLNLLDLTFLPQWVHPWTTSHDMSSRFLLELHNWTLSSSFSSPSVEAHACAVYCVAFYEHLEHASCPTPFLLILHTAQRPLILTPTLSSPQGSWEDLSPVPCHIIL